MDPWADWEDSEEEESTTASSGGSFYSTGEETENSYDTCSEPYDDDFSVTSVDLGRVLLQGRWTNSTVDRYRRLREDGWQDWHWFSEQERLLRLTFQAFGDVLEEAIRVQNDTYLRSLERERDNSKKEPCGGSKRPPRRLSSSCGVR